MANTRLLRGLILALGGLFPIWAALGQTPIPKLIAGINDPQHVLTEQQAVNLRRKIAAFEQGKDQRVVVLIVRDIGGEKLTNYGGRALASFASASGSGGGVALLAIQADRKSAWIEERGTDLSLYTRTRIVYETIVPRFEAGHDIAGGIDAGLDQLISVLGGSPLPPEPDRTGAWHSLNARLDSFRYEFQGKPESARLLEVFYFAIGVALGLSVRRFIGRWAAALLAAAVAAFGSWLQYGFIVPYAAGAFVIVVFGWKYWLGREIRSK